MTGKHHAFLGTALFSLVMVLGTSIAQAATTAAINATVTVQNISLTASDGSIAYGTMAVSTTRKTIAAEANDTQTATNNGNVAEDFNIQGANTANWTLAGTAGVDTYVHKFCIATCTVGGNYTALTTGYQTLATNIAASGSQTFDLEISTPTSSTVYTQQTASVTVQAVAN